MTEPASRPETPGPAAQISQSADPDDTGRVAPLRGASVQLNVRRLLQVTIGLVMGTLVVLVVVLTVAAIHSNEQIDELHDHGVPVTTTVNGCLGLLGGSGTNPEGYSCHGTYVLNGHRYTQSLPASGYMHPGTHVAAVAVPSDPALVSTAAALEDSARVGWCVHHPDRARTSVARPLGARRAPRPDQQPVRRNAPPRGQRLPTT